MALRAGNVPVGFQAVIWDRGRSVWRCDHAHRESGQATDCARAEIARRLAANRPKR